MNSVIIWCFLNAEQDELERILGDKCFSIRGSTSIDKKIEYEERWRNGERPILVTKVSVMGWGMNWQHSNTAIFCGMDYSYEGYYQAVRRLYRFGQTKPVDIYRVMGSTEHDQSQTGHAGRNAHGHVGSVEAPGHGAGEETLSGGQRG